MRIRIGIVDDHPAILVGTSNMISTQPDMQVVASASTVSGLLEWGVSIDVVLLDLSLADGSSIAENVRTLRPVVPAVLAYTAAVSPLQLRDAAQAGVDGIVMKTEELRGLCDAIRAVRNGQVPVSIDWAVALDSDAEFVSARLSAREREVLTLYASGETSERVAEALFISVQTVYQHVRRIRAKYAAVDRAAPTKVDLYRRAVEDGLVEP
ncbi:response regulator transcription factor [Microbacterium sp. No. 7]|uniref:response regulator transcription factor n=1 Tax=Microbacterium sp. No. 7 TaxID=1714373 RepID=UPI0006D0BC9E|nr:response regulator transcription factor [Microbacterium sp. No. 7]ALJ21174.1 hypothetical protein AOA12_15190 [Microbacterium sp. No. 7]